MKADIKAIHTISSSDINEFNSFVKTIAKDLQSDGLEVEVIYQPCSKNVYVNHNAMIIGRGK